MLPTCMYNKGVLLVGAGKGKKLVTVNFYSYKGGVGRTMIVAQFARLLAALGKRVVIADFDFDAPGVCAAFEIGLTGVRGGFYELALNVLTDGRMDAAKRKALTQELNEYLIDIPADDLINDKGSIQILPCGQIHEFWGGLDPFWTKYFVEPEGGGPSKASSIIDNFLKPALINGGADYLLIDSRSGVTNYGKLGWQIADRQVMLVCPNDESLEMTTGMFKFMLKPKDFPAESIFFAVSRIPPEIKDDLDMFGKLKKSIVENFETRHVFKLHSDLETLVNPHARRLDRRFHIDEKRRIDELERDGVRVNKNKKAEIVQLHRDILVIFTELFASDPGVVPPKPDKGSDEERLTRQIQEIWQGIFHDNFKITNKYRLFGFRPDLGRMINPDDRNRNIAFKTETFIKFLNRFYVAVTDTEAMNEALFNAGKQCGEAFGSNLVRDFRFDPFDDSFVKKVEYIKEWCRFDTEAGFGYMVCYADEAGGKLNIKLKVENLFIIDTRITDLRDYSLFFTGYTVGVLSRIIAPFELESVAMKKIWKIGDSLVPMGDFRMGYRKTNRGVGFVFDTFKISEENDNGILYNIELKNPVR